MIQCKDCELYQEDGPNGRKFLCNPFGNIKEPECIGKWTVIRLEMLIAMQQNIQSSQDRMAPIQNKIIKYVQREIDELEENDGWKYNEEDE